MPVNFNCAPTAYLVKFSPLSAARYKRLERYNEIVEAVIKDRSTGFVSQIDTGRVGDCNRSTGGRGMVVVSGLNTSE